MNPEAESGSVSFRTRETRMEVCIDSVESAIEAANGGATRVELCANLMEGGTTPSTGMIRMVKSACSLPVFVMIRPRGGDFCYSQYELEVMRKDILNAKECDADGIVFGVLQRNGEVDLNTCEELIGL